MIRKIIICVVISGILLRVSGVWAQPGVRLSQLRPIASDRLIGSGAGETGIREISLGDGLSFTGSTLSVSGNARIPGFTISDKDKFLKIGSDGNTVGWASIPSAFSNGLSVNNGIALLGGMLTQTTTFEMSAATSVIFDGEASSGTGDFIVRKGNGAFCVYSSSSTQKFQIDKDGKAYLSGDLTVDGDFYTPSDKRLKRSIETLNDVLPKIDHIRGIQFEYIDQHKYAKGPQLGVIAQEIQAVFPELVGVGENGYLKVDYVHLTAVLLQGIKEQQSEILDLKQKMQELADKLEKHD